VRIRTFSADPDILPESKKIQIRKQLFGEPTTFSLQQWTNFILYGSALAFLLLDPTISFANPKILQ
jgi:hypothetical protein